MTEEKKETNENKLNGLFSGEVIRTRHYFMHLGYYIPHWIKLFFSRPFKPRRKDLNILDQVNSLLSVETTNENLEKCKQLTDLHRVVENTRARRRLERWSLRVIVCYLLVVLCIVVLSYCKTDKMTPILEIPDTIMVTILSTTTVNIIGLGLIVLKGHFLFNDQHKGEGDSTK